MVAVTVPSTMSKFTMSHAAPDHDLQEMLLHRQVKSFRLEFFSRKPLHIRVCLVTKKAGSTFITKYRILLHVHLTAPAGVLTVPPCPLNLLAPLDISHQPLPACMLAGLPTELILTYGWSKICSAVCGPAEFLEIVPTKLNVKLEDFYLKILIFKGKTNTSLNPCTKYN